MSKDSVVGQCEELTGLSCLVLGVEPAAAPPCALAVRACVRERVAGCGHLVRKDIRVAKRAPVLLPQRTSKHLPLGAAPWSAQSTQVSPASLTAAPSAAPEAIKAS